MDKKHEVKVVGVDKGGRVWFASHTVKTVKDAERVAEFERGGVRRIVRAK